MSEQHCRRVPIRVTAAERQFEQFITAARRFGCDGSAGRFEQTLAMLVAASSGRRSLFDGPASGGGETREPAHAALARPLVGE
jgi:hypothetical protein